MRGMGCGFLAALDALDAFDVARVLWMTLGSYPIGRATSLGGMGTVGRTRIVGAAFLARVTAAFMAALARDGTAFVVLAPTFSVVLARDIVVLARDAAAFIVALARDAALDVNDAARAFAVLFLDALGVIDILLLFANNFVSGDDLGEALDDLGDIFGDNLRDGLGEVFGEVLDEVLGEVLGDILGDVLGDTLGDVLGDVLGVLGVPFPLPRDGFAAFAAASSTSSSNFTRLSGDSSSSSLLESLQLSSFNSSISSFHSSSSSVSSLRSAPSTWGSVRCLGVFSTRSRSRSSRMRTSLEDFFFVYTYHVRGLGDHETLPGSLRNFSGGRSKHSERMSSLRALLRWKRCPPSCSRTTTRVPGRIWRLSFCSNLFVKRG